MADTIIRIPLVTRRAAVVGAAAFAGAGGAAVSQDGQRVSPTGACLVMPQATEGPYYFDPRLERSDIRGGRQGSPVRLLVGVQDTDCRPLKGARVDIWHWDAQGTYSGYFTEGQQADARGETFLRGHQSTDDNGEASFQTIYPGWYPGRTPHIHLKVILGSSEVMTTQLYFPDELSDRIYRQPAYAKAGARLNNANDGIARRQGPAAFASVSPERDGHLVRILVGVDPMARRPLSRGRPQPK